MKKHTFTTKTTLFCKLLLLLLAALLFVSCSQAVKMPSDKTLRQIELDYGRYVFGEEYDPAVHGDGSTSKCYGIYNGCVPMCFEGYALSYAAVETTEEIAGITFEYGSSNTIQVWKDGNFYSMQDAYDQTYLTTEDVQTIFRLRYKTDDINLFKDKEETT